MQSDNRTTLLHLHHEGRVNGGQPYSTRPIGKIDKNAYFEKQDLSIATEQELKAPDEQKPKKNQFSIQKINNFKAL